MTTSHEEWRPIPGYTGYEASSQGRIRVAKPMQIRLGNRGYLFATIIGDDGVRRSKVVHRLVLKAFVGMPPFADAVGNHRNGIKTDNRPENLEWSTHSENQKHAYRVLGRVPSEKRPLTVEELATIREVYAAGHVTIHGLAAIYKIHKQRVARILADLRRPKGVRPGSVSPQRAFTPEQDAEIYRRLLTGNRNKDLAAEFGVSTMTIYTRRSDGTKRSSRAGPSNECTDQPRAA